MGLQVRNGHYCYTKSKRVNSKVKSEYRGSGILTIYAYQWDQQERQEAEEAKRQQRARWQGECEAADALDQAVNVACDSATAPVTARRQPSAPSWARRATTSTHEASGARGVRTDRRRNRMETDTRDERMAGKLAQLLQEDNLPAEWREGLELTMKAIAGDEEAMGAAVLSLANVEGITPTGGTALTIGQ